MSGAPVYETDMREFCGLKCKIQMRQVLGIWQQRHIWYPSSAAPYLKGPDAEEWIRAIQRPPGDTFKPVKRRARKRA